MEEIVLEKNDELVMKLLYFFITESGYSPIILHGAKNEIWLENLDSDYKIVRIVTNYIHNNEQLNFDLFKTKKIVDKIKKKTFTFSANTLSIFVNLGDNVETPSNTKNIDCVHIKDLKDFKKYNFILDIFPNITKKTEFKEKGLELFTKITTEINKTSEAEQKKADDVFKPKKPIVTYILIAINVIVFLLMYILGNGSEDVDTLVKFGANVSYYVKNGEIYRLITSAFIHIGLFHLVFNMYALYLIGSQIESFYGKTKYIIIYFFSAIIGNLLSVLFLGNGISAGASGAIFGLFGALLYFGYHYRVYLGTVIKSQIIPLICLNLFLGFTLGGVDNAAHIGGLIAGYLVSMAVGVKYKTTRSENINGVVLSVICLVFLVLMLFK